MINILRKQLLHPYTLTRGDDFELSLIIGEQLPLSDHTIKAQYRLGESDTSERRDFQVTKSGQLLTLSVPNEDTAKINVSELYFDIQFQGLDSKKFTPLWGKIPVALDSTQN